MRLTNSQTESFEQLDGWCVGYRTHNSPVVGDQIYEVGKWYKAPVFSVCTTKCHPGLYVFPSADDVVNFVGRACKIVKVLFQDFNCHKADDKYRVREFLVWEDC
jgi:hypothetical protein